MTTANAYIRSLARLWRESILEDVPVALRLRPSRLVGRYLPAANRIEVNASMLSAPSLDRREVLCHEAAHAVVWARHGRNARPHGPEWQALMRQAGFEPRASVIRCGHRAQRNTAPRFRHRCPVCHFSRTAKRRMTNWRCPECRAIGLDGELRIQRIASRR